MDNDTLDRFDRIERGLLRITEGLDRNIASQSQLTESISQYIDASEARMGRIEQNLDALIRAIMADHSNGKGL